MILIGQVSNFSSWPLRSAVPIGVSNRSDGDLTMRLIQKAATSLLALSTIALVGCQNEKPAADNSAKSSSALLIELSSEYALPTPRSVRGGSKSARASARELRSPTYVECGDRGDRRLKIARWRPTTPTTITNH